MSNHVTIINQSCNIGACDNGRKINIWSTNKFSKELHTAVLVTFNTPSSV